jgi:isopenicillin-N N-acyltransferase-like protein
VTSTSDLSFPEITVSGGPFERGRQHGSQAGDLIRQYLDRFVAELRQGAGSRPLARSGVTPTRDLILVRTMEFLPSYEEFAPHLVEEIRGLAAGAHLTFAEALLCNVHGE